MTANPAAALDHILATLVLPPEDGGGGAMARE
jgi:hypothetical protein